MARRRFFIDRVRNAKAVLAGAEAHHLGHVLRAQPGQLIEVSDGARAYLAEIESTGEHIVLRIREELPAALPAARITLVASLIKFDRFEWLVEKVTELGVETIVPVATERSEKGLLEAAAKRVERWRKIAAEASRQSRRVSVPEVQAPVRMSDALSTPAEARYWLEETGGEPLGALGVNPALALAVGPEGGWTDRERAAFRAAGWTPAALGESILRAETAAMAALAVVSHTRWAAARNPVAPLTSPGAILSDNPDEKGTKKL